MFSEDKIKKSILLSTKEKQSLLKDIEDMGNDEPQWELDELIRWFTNLPKKLEIYRLIFVNDENEVNVVFPGEHFSHDKNGLLISHYKSLKDGSYGKLGVLITAKVEKENIDVFETIRHNILYPNENEITVKNKGKNIEIVSIKKIKR